MAGAEYSSWEELAAAIDAVVPAVLESSVAPVMESIVTKHVKEDVYDAYTPKPGGWSLSRMKSSVRSAYAASAGDSTYHRRNSLYNLKSEMQGRNTLLTTTSSAPAPAVVRGWSFHNRRDGAFFQLLESGKTGIWRGGFPRYPIRNAQREIDRGLEAPRSNLSKAIRSGFAAQGIKVN